MADTVAPEFARFVEAERRAQRLPAATRPMVEGEVFKPVFIEAGRSTELRARGGAPRGGLLPAEQAHRGRLGRGRERAGGDVRRGGREAVAPASSASAFRCAATRPAPASIELLFAGRLAASSPAGLYAAAARRPNGPDIIVSTWGDALVAFAWQCVLGLVTGIAAATGKDQRGNLLVPVEIAVTGRGIEIVPMARHRFAGSSTLKTATKLGSGHELRRGRPRRPGQPGQGAGHLRGRRQPRTRAGSRGPRTS